MEKSLWSMLEILGHHAEKGPIWDGNQIGKRERDELIRGGYLARLGDGYTNTTHAGLATWKRWKMLYRIAHSSKKMKWRASNIKRKVTKR